MIAFQEFKSSLLIPLLRQDYPTLGALLDTPLTLFAAAMDHPLDFLFESAGWQGVSGASQRLTRAGEQIAAVLAMEGYAADSLLHLDSGSALALVHDPKVTERCMEGIERAVAHETDLVTATMATCPITARQLINGLYRAPDTVIGVPGIHDYQNRINRYYGLSSPSTVPSSDSVAARRHFGEVIAHVHRLLSRAGESREIFPFYEMLPFAERCNVCQHRPAERLEDAPICGVCARNRAASKADQLDRASLVLIQALDFERALEGLRLPSMYRAFYSDIDETLRVAMPNRVRAQTLFTSRGRLWLALAAENALEGAVTALEAIAAHYNQRPPLGFAASVVLGSAPDQMDQLYDLAIRTADNMRRETQSVTGFSLDVRYLGQPFDRFRKPYRLDEARRLLSGVHVLREANLPEGLFADLPAQIQRGSAGLYYAFERNTLPDSVQPVFARFEQALNLSPASGVRYYAILHDALALARIKV